MAKCNHCYRRGTEVKLSACSRCKAAKYCSKECQKADWASHKEQCNKTVEHAEALKSVFNPMNLIPLPDGLTLSQLDQRLEKWIKFHSPTLMGATIHALGLPRDLSRASTHVVRTQLAIRTDHGGSPAKFFRIREVEAIPIEEAKKLRDPWRESLEDFQKMREESEAMGRGTVAAMGVVCPPLGVQMVPFGSLTDLSLLPKVPQWKEVLIKDVENGKKYGRFGR
ncbi:hypothetical protein BV22DRAFT_1079996 [Leucogyrophana mollusca]|uniref:Uncharacterized protein n=1 Tax=Leucogyrophana mollusca TaxID=85980 RepID=A0ACB8BYS7_9AGAM|nr:hypothetical protein BV22DRAFT_1079996 [Leucogyrophana mollusca]